MSGAYSAIHLTDFDGLGVTAETGAGAAGRDQLGGGGVPARVAGALSAARTEQSQLVAAPPRLVSVSLRSKQYSHCASSVGVAERVVARGRSAAPCSSRLAGIWPLITAIEVCS